MKKTMMQLSVLVLTAIYLTSCSSKTDGEKIETVTIGKQVWMLKNLDVVVICGAQMRLKKNTSNIWV